jgi:hypothetical protein
MLWTRLRLLAWGRWARGGLPGLPTMSNIEKARVGRGGTENMEMPPHIAEVDVVICRAPQPEKSVLITYYSKSGPLAEKAQMLHMDRWSFKRALVSGESYVESNL